MFNVSNQNIVLSKLKQINKDINIIAVSKTKSIDAISEAYNVGLRSFGENQIQELTEKFTYLPEDIKWHFIGHIQSNKIKPLLSVKNLYSIDSISSIKHLEKINNILYQNLRKKDNLKSIKFKIEINSSKEESKGGIQTYEELFEIIDTNFDQWTERIDDLIEIIIQKQNKKDSNPSVDEIKSKIMKNQKNLNEVIPFKFSGIMTLNKIGDQDAYSIMNNLKSAIKNKYDINCICSMGTTQDYEEAANYGSDEVRIGTLLFGDREIDL